MSHVNKTEENDGLDLTNGPNKREAYLMNQLVSIQIGLGPNEIAKLSNNCCGLGSVELMSLGSNNAECDGAEHVTKQTREVDERGMEKRKPESVKKKRSNLKGL